MWQIVWAEFRYTSKLTLFVVALIIPGVLAYVQMKPAAGIRAILLPLSVSIPMLPLIFRSIEKRERQQALLPVSIREIAMARVLLFLVSTVCIYGGYMILYLTIGSTSQVWNHDLYDLMMFFGLTLFGFSAFLVLHDFCRDRFVNYNAGELDMAVLVGLTSFVLLAIPLAMTMVKSPVEDYLRVMCFVSGFGLLYPAVLSFSRRKSFLE